jgi:hypothetical protein
MISREDFARWKEDPVTRAVVRAHRKTADDNRDAWVKHSWDNGHANPLTLLELRTRADAYMAIAEIGYADVCGAIGAEPREE